MTNPLKFLWLLPALLVWAVYIAVNLSIAILGFIPVLFGAIFKQYEEVTTPATSAYPNRKMLAWKSKFMWLLGNKQNGLDGATGDDLPPGWPKSTWPKWLQIVRWSGLRNSVGNGRWTSLLGTSVYPDKVVTLLGDKTNARGPFLVRQGWRFQGRFPWSKTGTRVFRIGWGLAEQTGVVDCPNGVGFSVEPWNTI